MGIEVGLGGWVNTFMLRVRHTSAKTAQFANMGFWLGMTVGRASLGFVTNHFGDARCVPVYIFLALALQLIFWLVRQYIVSAVAVALLGMFLGPMFPACAMKGANLLPKHMHVAGLGFAMALGGVGGTVAPYAIGAIAGHAGVGVLPPIVFGMEVVLLALWLTFPKAKNGADAQETESSKRPWWKRQFGLRFH
jgi:fucose permease